MSILSCTECSKPINTDYHPDVFQLAGITYCSDCAPSCGNCKKWSETAGSATYRKAYGRTRGYGYCDWIKTELFVEIIGLSFDVEDPKVKMETPSFFGCSEWTASNTSAVSGSSE